MPVAGYPRSRYFPRMDVLLIRTRIVHPALSFWLCVAATWVEAQVPEAEYHVVQAVVEGLRSPGQCGQVDVYLRAQADVIVARTDFNTRNVMIQVPRYSDLSEAHVRALFESLGLGIRCYRRLPLASSLYTPLDPRTCTEAPVSGDH